MSAPAVACGVAERGFGLMIGGDAAAVQRLDPIFAALAPAPTSPLRHPVVTSALYARFSSRGEGDFADRLLSAMRMEFGGHHEKAGTPTS